MPARRDASGRFVSGGGATSGGGFSGIGGGSAIAIKTRIQWTPQKLEKQVQLGTIWSLGRAGAYIRGIARKSIKKSAMPSAPGSPPHTKRGALKNAIRFDVEKERQSVVIGPTKTGIGTIGQLHEFGGTRKSNLGKRVQFLIGRFGFTATARIIGMDENALRERAGTLRYPKRAFMGPALAISRERLPKFWAQSVRGG